MKFFILIMTYVLSVSSAQACLVEYTAGALQRTNYDERPYFNSYRKNPIVTPRNSDDLHTGVIEVDEELCKSDDILFGHIDKRLTTNGWMLFDIVAFVDESKLTKENIEYFGIYFRAF